MRTLKQTRKNKVIKTMNAQSRLQTKNLSPQSSSMTAPTGLLQRKCAACSTHTIAGGKCEDCKNEQDILQRKSSNNSEQSNVPPIVNEVLNSSGQPLDKTTRAFFESRFAHNFSRVPVSSVSRQMSQSSLKVGEPTSVYEQEADRIADSVMLKDGHEKTLSTNKQQSEKFDLSHVRIHTDARAAASARAVNALAYTVGNNIVFGAGQFAPETHKGRRLIAHELTHVAQQSNAEKGGSPTMGNTIQRQLGDLSIGEIIGEGIGSVVLGGPGKTIGGMIGRKVEGSTKKIIKRLEKIKDTLQGKKEVKLPPEDVFAVNVTLAILGGLLPSPVKYLLPNALSGREQRFSPLMLVFAAPAVAAFALALVIVVSAAMIAIIIVEVVRYFDRIADKLEKAEEVKPKPIPMTPTTDPVAPAQPSPIPMPRSTPAPTPKPTPKPTPTTDIIPVTPTQTEPDPDKKKRKKKPPFVLKLPQQKAPHLETYRSWLGVLQSDPNYARGSPAQLDKWHQAHRIGGSHAVPASVYERGHALGFTGTNGERRIRVPNWSRSTKNIVLEVDHIIELQVTPASMRREFNSVDNYELLDKQANGTSGPLMANNIAAERALQVAADPSLVNQILRFDKVELDGGTPGKRWSSEEIRAGEQLDAYEKNGK